ncbi:MAG: outer membrane beta-barrel protein [Alphaproteobacteria bacterium]|nr:outer membrane beta-barrel protein [Alphaproteobacteria bacterium]
MVPRSAATILSALGLVLAATMPVAAQSQGQGQVQGGNQSRGQQQEQTTLEKIGIGGDLKPYFSLFGGGVFVQEASLEGTNSLDGDLSHDLGFLVGVTGGFEPRENLRAEGEFAFRQVDASTLSLTAPGFSGFSPGDTRMDGQVRTFSFMGNLWFDLPVGGDFITPFLGGGVGIAELAYNEVRADDNDTLFADDGDFNFAYQLGSGLSFRLFPKLRMDAAYRYFVVVDPEVTLAGNERIETEFDSHNFLVSFRLNF